MKRAILIDPEFLGTIEPLVQTRPSSMLAVFDKPIIEHILEKIKDLGFDRVDLILHHHPHVVEEHIGGGSRFGVEIVYHLLKCEKRLVHTLKLILETINTKDVLLAAANTLPLLDSLAKELEGGEVLLYHKTYRWLYWALLGKKGLERIPLETSFEDFPHYFPKAESLLVKEYLSTRSYSELARSNMFFSHFAGKKGFFPVTSKEVEKEVWFSKGVVMKPSIEIVPPVFIGEFCYIEKGATIGPYAVIENHCVIDSLATVKHSLVLKNSYIGEGLYINQSIVDRNLLINLSLQSKVFLVDDFLLSEIKPFTVSYHLFNMFERIIFLILFLLFSPIYVLLSYTREIKEMEFVSIPSNPNKENQHLFTLKEFVPKKGGIVERWAPLFLGLPKLLSGIKGKVHLAGIQGKTLYQFEALAPDFRKIYTSAKIGLITLADLKDHPVVSEDEMYTSDCYYFAHMGPLFDLWLIFKWALLSLRKA